MTLPQWLTRSLYKAIVLYIYGRLVEIRQKNTREDIDVDQVANITAFSGRSSKS